MGGVLQSLEAGKVQRYKWGAYCCTNWRCTAVLSSRPVAVGVSETPLNFVSVYALLSFLGREIGSRGQRGTTRAISGQLGRRPQKRSHTPWDDSACADDPGSLVPGGGVPASSCS